MSALAGCAYSAAGQAASALHCMAVLQVYQAKMLTSEEDGLDAASLRDLRSTTDLALRSTKATTQAIGQSMSRLVVLECLEGVPSRQDATPFRSDKDPRPKITLDLAPCLTGHVEQRSIQVLSDHGVLFLSSVSLSYQCCSYRTEICAFLLK